MVGPLSYTTYSMSKSIFQASLSDPDAPNTGAETEEDEETAKSWDLS